LTPIITTTAVGSTSRSTGGTTPRRRDGFAGPLRENLAAIVAEIRRYGAEPILAGLDAGRQRGTARHPTVEPEPSETGLNGEVRWGRVPRDPSHDACPCRPSRLDRS
jgi:hypothetical protein